MIVRNYGWKSCNNSKGFKNCYRGGCINCIGVHCHPNVLYHDSIFLLLLFNLRPICINSACFRVFNDTI